MFCLSADYGDGRLRGEIDGSRIQSGKRNDRKKNSVIVTCWPDWIRRRNENELWHAHGHKPPLQQRTKLKQVEGRFSGKKISAFFISAYFSEGHGPRSEAVS